MLITRRDGDALVLTKASRVGDDREGLELASALVAASLAPDSSIPFVERLRMPFPWLALLSRSEQEIFAKEIVDIARGCAALACYDQLLATPNAWLATAEAVAAGYTPDDELQWLDAAEVVADPRG